jgi:LacI family transcriptional regulator
LSVPHRFLVKDIAFQARLSTATVDRVLNGRSGVRGQTALRVAAAVKELERQEASLARGGRTFTVDVVMEAPDRFTREARAAFESEAGAFYPNMFRLRFQGAEVMPQESFVSALDRIRLRGSDGVVVKARGTPEITEAARKLGAAGIPVITLVTDLPGSGRLAYAGMNNRAAGETAAFLIAQTLGSGGGHVLATLSSSRFHGEEERLAGFREALAARHRNIVLAEISEGFGRDTATGALARAALQRAPDICAVYSAGGGNRAILQAFEDEGRKCRVFVAHDLDADNRDLLAQGRISYVLHHDLKQDIRTIYRLLLHHHHAAGAAGSAPVSEIAVVTPFNMTDAFNAQSD